MYSDSDGLKFGIQCITILQADYITILGHPTAVVPHVTSWLLASINNAGSSRTRPPKSPARQQTHHNFHIEDEPTDIQGAHK